MFGLAPVRIQNAYLPFCSARHRQLPEANPAFRAALARPPEEDRRPYSVFLQIFSNPASLRDLDWLRAQTKLPLLLKGVLHPDAPRSRDSGWTA